MKIAIETTLFRAISLHEALKAISAQGIKDIEIGLSHFDVYKATRAQLRELSEACGTNGVSLAAIFGLYQLASLEEDKRKVAVEQMKGAVEKASSLDCRRIVSELGGTSHYFVRHLRSFRKSIEHLIPTLENSDIIVSLEAHSGDFIEDSNEAAAFVKSFDSKALRYLYCIAHTFTLGGESRKNILNARDVLNYVHVADTLRPERTFFSATYNPKVKPHQHLVPGLGDVDFKEVFGALKEIEYDGPLVLDPFSHADRAIWAARESKRYIQRLLKDITT